MSCPVCGADGTRSVYRLEPRALVRCVRCGLVRVDPMPTQRDALELYDAGYFEDPEIGYADYLGDERVFRAEFRRRLRTIEAAGGRGRLFDAGCATGGLLLEARARGFSVSGLEPSEAVAGVARERTGAPVRAQPLERVLLDRFWYDVITLFDVLEHLVDPVPPLRVLRGALRPEGLLAVTVPDFGGWWSRVTGPRWPFVTPWEHLTYFTRRTLVTTLRAAGFREIKFAHARTPLSFGTLAHHVRPIGWMLPGAQRHRGIALPFGTLFALARP